ncbi:MAG: flagellar motor protein MotB [Marinilabiliales bacterium]|nr:MAG: flagellar motor protein MotB [Marinilabiliales bacterium]
MEIVFSYKIPNMRALTVKILLIIVAMGLFSCVPTKQFNELEDRCLEERSNLKKQLDKLETELNEKSAEFTKISREREGLIEDTTQMGLALRDIQRSMNKQRTDYEEMLSQQRNLLAGKDVETSNILAEIQELREDLIRREDAVSSLEDRLSEKEQRLNTLQDELSQKEARLDELQTILDRQEAVVSALRKTVADALLGFEGKGLTIEEKNGKVYVSMDENLLFKSGSWMVADKGVEALKKLAKVLEENKDINVMIEGHTDNVPYRGSAQVKDNWDLSVMRATSVLKIIVQNSNVDEKRLAAAGRGEYYPIADNKTPEGRAANRRTEIILTPKLDELFKIIETN